MLTNSNKICNPLGGKHIYRVTTTCHLSVNGIWRYSAKIFFRNGQTKAVHELTSSSYEKLIELTRLEMIKLKTI